MDAREKKYIDELSAANFFAVRGNTFITPASPSILASITNMSVQRLASDLGLKVEQRPISIDEVASFNKAGALGTAADITPVGAITYGDKEYVYARDGKAGAITTQLYTRLRATQARWRGERPLRLVSLHRRLQPREPVSWLWLIKGSRGALPGEDPRHRQPTSPARRGEPIGLCYPLRYEYDRSGGDW